MRVYFFPKDTRVDPVVLAFLRGLTQAEMKRSSALFKWEKIGGQLGPRSFFPPKSPHQNFDSHFVQHRHNSYQLCLSGRLIPHSPQGKDSKLWTSPIVYIWYLLLVSMRRFREDFYWRGDWVTWENLPVEEFFMGEDHFYEGDTRFPRIIWKMIRN